MTAKKWCISFLIIIIVALLFIAGTNFFVDPYGYFKAQKGENYTCDEEDYLREQKAEHIKYHGKEYDAFLVGGSKAGAIKAEKLSEIDGYKYYNCWLLSGNFEDYYEYINFILKNAKPKKILLHLSTSEIANFDRESKGDIYEIPAVMKGEKKYAEYIKFLFKNLKVSYETVTNKETTYPLKPTGERNLDKYYEYLDSHRDVNEYYNYLMKDMVDPYLPRLTQGTKDKSALVEKNMDYLKKIKELCDKKDVEFQVFLGTLFIGEMVGYEGDSFYNWLIQMVQLTDGLWCFNNYNDLVYNPFNYYNARHYYYETADLMIDKMSGKEIPYKDFGVYLTRDNIMQEIATRTQKTNEVREYYKQTGTIPIKGYDDESNIMRNK